MSKRIILFGPLPPPYGGVSVLLSSLFGHLKDCPVFVWAIFGQDWRDRRITRFNHRRLGVIKALAKQGYKSRIVDFTHFHLEYPNPILLPIWLIAKTLLGFEWIKHVNDGSLPARYANFSRAQRRRFKRALNAIDELIVVNSDLRDWLVDEIGVHQKLTLIPSLFNIPAETQNAPLSRDTETALNDLARRQKRVCSIGTFIPSYGFQHVAEAVEKIRTATNEDIGLLLLDGSFAHDASFRDGVLRGRDWITVLTDVPNPEIYQVLSRCDLFVRAFEAESYGISRVEAIWSGTPVIAVDVGETRGMLTYRFGDVETLVRLIGEVLAGESKFDLTSWSNLFHAEADENLRRFVETVRIECGTEVLSSVEVRA
jgi:glycosyltransferase involved in cell wall biosynthesis